MDIGRFGEEDLSETSIVMCDISVHCILHTAIDTE